MRYLNDDFFPLVICIFRFRLFERNTSEKLIITQELTRLGKIDAERTNWYRLDLGITENKEIKNYHTGNWRAAVRMATALGSPNGVHHTDQRPKWFFRFSVVFKSNKHFKCDNSIAAHTNVRAGRCLRRRRCPVNKRASPISTNYHLIDSHNDVVGDNQRFFLLCHWPRSCSATVTTRMLPHSN